jgi:hypothetical protein
VEGTIKARPSKAYTAKKAALHDEQVHLSLDLMEEAVAAEPDNWTHRERVGDVIWDKSELNHYPSRPVVSTDSDSDRIADSDFVTVA